MKKTKKLICLLLVMIMLVGSITVANAIGIATDDEAVLFPVMGSIGGNIATPQWSTNDGGKNRHSQIIDYAQDNASTTIPTDYINIVKKYCKYCDSRWNNSGDKPFSAVHAGGNYVATLKYLWYYTKKIRATATASNYKTAAEEADTYARGKVGSVSGFTDKAKAVYNQMRDMTKRVIKAHGLNNESGEENLAVCSKCKYIMYGLLMHYFGDLYAHRPLIKEKALNPNNLPFNEATMINKDHFYSTAAEINNMPADKKSWNTLKTDIRNDKVSFTQLKTKYEKPGCHDYEDNVNFYPNRFMDSKKMAKAFLNSYGDGYTVNLINSKYGFELQDLTYYKNKINE